jgi:uncharacterized membrane protein YhaH (DUF805 family)
MSFVEAIKSGYKKYGTFKGRASRKEFWYFFLYNVLVFFVLSFLSGTLDDYEAATNMLASFTAIFIVANIVPMLALVSRRFHDIGKSGSYIFLWLIPLVGPFLVIGNLCFAGQPFDNKYGENPNVDNSLLEEINNIGNNEYQKTDI